MKRNFLLLALTSLFLMPVFAPTQLYSQQKTEVPTVHNKALDEKFLKFCKTSDETKMINEFINNVYKEYGTYLGSATIQRNIDLNIFLEFLDGNIEILKKFDENAYKEIDKEAMKKVTARSEPIKQWLKENYWNVYNQPFQFDHQPDIDEVVYALDKFVTKNPNNIFGDNFVYILDSKTYYKYITNNNINEVQKYSDYIAAKVSTADFMLFINLTRSLGLYQSKEDKAILDNLLVLRRVTNPILKNQ